MKKYRQEAPFCLKIELTEGCPLRCTFCGINGIRGKEHEYKFMTVETADKITRQVADLGWNARIEMGMRGEPSMNPNIREIMATIRGNLPKAYMVLISNGAGFQKRTLSSIKELFAAGLNTIIIDQYDDIQWSHKIQRVVMKPNRLPGVQIFHYPDCGKEGNPHKRSRKKRLVFIPPINHITKAGTHSTSSLFNHGACGGPPTNEAQGKRCTRPFREITFRHDGVVPICCSDWRGAYVVGHIDETSVEELWNHPRIHAARKYLYHGKRDFRPCKGCDCTGYRIGLLPDKMGKETLPKPTKKDAAIVAEALAAGPATTPVELPWEKEMEI